MQCTNYQLKSLFFLSILFLIGCTGTKNATVKSDLDKVIENSIKNIEKGKAVSKNKANLQTTLTQLIEKKTSEKTILLQSYDLLEREKGVEIIEYLESKIALATPHIGNVFELELNNLKEEKTTASDYLKEEYFKKGKERLKTATEQKNRTIAREAYTSLEKAKKYGMTENNINDLLEESYGLAYVVYVVKKEMAADKQYQYTVDDQLEELERLNRNFTKIHYNKTVEKRDCDIVIYLQPLIINTEEGKEYKSFQKTVQTGTRTVNNPDGTTKEVPVMGVVRARVTIGKMTKRASWEANIKVFPQSESCKVENKTIQENFVNSSNEFVIEGDERAVPQDYKNSFQEALMRDREIVEELLNRIYRRMESEVF